MKSILPLILVILALTGAISYSLFKRTFTGKPVDSIGIPANELKNDVLTPTPSITKQSQTSNETKPILTITPTVVVPEVTETVGTLTKTVTKTTICTPVYGSADTCTEHITVDTGAENAPFLNFAGLAYLTGLISFIKAKSLKK